MGMRSGRRRKADRTRSDNVATPSLVRSATRLGEAHCSSRVSSIRTMRSDVRATSASNALVNVVRSEEHTSELQSLMRISYAVFCLTKKNNHTQQKSTNYT